jgi:phosphate:Na+ symporter
LALGEAGAVTLPVVLAVVVGANIGLGLTSLIAGWGTLEGRRLTWANLIIKCLVAAAVFAAFDPLVELVSAMPGTLTRHGADLHTGFNIAAALLGLALAGLVSAWMTRMIRPEVVMGAGAPAATHLDPRALGSPVFALANASREVLRLADDVQGMLAGSWQAYQQHSAEQAAQVRARDDRVDELHASIKNYLSHIAVESLNPRDSELRFGLLHFASQLEAVGDIVAKELCVQASKHAERPLPLAAEDSASLAELQERVQNRLSMAISLLATRERSLAEEFLKEGETLKEWCIEVQKKHYERLRSGDPEGLEASGYFLDMFNSLRRISGQVNSIGHTFRLVGGG